MVAVLVGVALAAATTLGPTVATASAEVLFEQPVGPSGVGVPSNEMAGGIANSTEAMDDFVVPAGTRWRLELAHFFGAPATPIRRPFVVRIWEAIPGVPYPSWYDPLFETSLWNEDGHDATLSLWGAPLLGPGDYWIAVQQVDAEGRGDWSWLTGPDTPGTMPASSLAAGQRPAGAEPGQAFQLLGVATQRLTVYAEGYGTVHSLPPGIDCSTICTAEFARGTNVTLIETSLPGLEFKEWQWGASLQAAPSCATTNGCGFALESDTTVFAKSAYQNEISVLRLARDLHTGGGELVVSLPGEGVLSMSGRGLESLHRTPLPSGQASIPLVPRGELAQRLLRKGSATTTLVIRFRPSKGANPRTIERKVTLVRKHPRKVVHNPARRVH